MAVLAVGMLPNSIGLPALFDGMVTVGEVGLFHCIQWYMTVMSALIVWMLPKSC